MKFKKGQAAMEFLMTYGWAILVVLAAIGALAYFGVLSPDRFLPSKCTVAGGFSCTEYLITADEVQMRIANNLGVDATYFEMNVTQKGAATNCLLQYRYSTASSSFSNGGDTGLIAGVGATNADWDAENCASLAGKFKADIDVWYTRSGESVVHKTSGSISGNVE